MITGVYKSKATEFLKFIHENSLTIILFSCFTAGVILGTAITKNDSSLIERALMLIEDFIKLRKEQSMFQTLCNSMLSNIIIIIPIFVAGLCAVGIPIIFSIPFAKGIGLGFITAFFYSNYGMNGLGHCILVIFPGAVIAVLTIILASKMSVMQSARIFKATANGKGNINRFISFCKRFTIYLLMFLVSSVVDGILNRLFSTVFIS